MPTAEVPRALAQRVIQTWGAEGRQWLADLPGVRAEVVRRWDLDPGAPFAMSSHWVAAATRSDGSPAVLKLGLPAPGHLATEVAALRAFDGHGAVRLLAHDAALGALLLERADPGTPASALCHRDDEQATAAILAVTHRLHRPPPPDCPLPDLATQGRAFPAYLRRYPGDRPLPRHLVQRAGRLFDELCASATGRTVLHGDLHHDNVLRAGREPWLAIDPHGVVGDPGYELGAMLFNPGPERREPALLALVPARIEQLADGLRLPVERVVAWGFVKAVLSEVWSVQGGQTPGSRALDVAVQLAPRLP